MNDYMAIAEYEEQCAIDEGIVGNLLMKGAAKFATHQVGKGLKKKFTDFSSPEGKEKLKDKATQLRSKGADALRKAGGVGMNVLTGGHYTKMRDAQKGADDDDKDIASAKEGLQKAAAEDAAARKKHEENMAGLSAQVEKEAKDRESRGAAAEELANTIKSEYESKVADERGRRNPITKKPAYKKGEEPSPKTKKKLYVQVADTHQQRAEDIAGKNPTGKKWSIKDLKGYSSRTAADAQAIRDSEASRREAMEKSENERRQKVAAGQTRANEFIGNKERSREANRQTAADEKRRAIRTGAVRGTLALAATAAGATMLHDHKKYGDAFYRIHRMHDKRMVRKLAEKEAKEAAKKAKTEKSGKKNVGRR